MSSSWIVEWDDKAVKALKKLDRSAQKKIIEYLENRIATSEDPYRFGKALTADKKGLWRYRVGDHRIICHIDDEIVTVLVLHVDHRKEVYQ